MNATRIPILTTAILLAMSAGVSADEAVTLRYKAGKSPLLYRVKTQHIQKQKLGDGNLDTDTVVEDVSQWTLKKTDDKGRLHWEKNNKRYKATMNVPSTGKFTYDSKSSERERSGELGSVLTPICEALTDSLIRIETQPTGRINTVTEYEALVGKLIKNDPLATQFAFAGSNAGARLFLQESFLIFSGKPVKPGNTWTVPYTISVPGLGDMKAKKTYKYLGAGKIGERKTVRIGISYDGAFVSKFQYDKLKGNGSLTITKSSGVAHFDPVAGQLVALKSRFDFSGTINIAFGNDNTQPMDSKQSWSIEVSRLDKLPE